MSVGAQRLREDAERVRQGAIDKGEDPSIVDAALAADARRRELLAEGDRLKGERNSASKAVGEAIRGSAVELAAQDVHWEKQGAYTGEISGPMARDVGAAYAIVGHSERRSYHAESDQLVADKAKAAVVAQGADASVKCKLFGWTVTVP